jgi:uroporphyrinogen III methyltransferase / synthase
MKQPAVYLIGTGPGDPGLITVHGLEVLRGADVVIYDRTISPRLLAFARTGAELIDVGSPVSREMAQEAISYLLADKAREDKVIARLKRGDSFVFDHGGEEALFLHEQGIPFEVIPGIPAGIGVPAYAGVPVTYPGGGDTITLVRGFEDESRTLPNVDWASLAKLEGTMVYYAGAQQLPRVLATLLSSGWSAEERAVIVYDGTLPTQETLAGSLGELLDRLKAAPRRQPAILVVGPVVGFRDHLRWFDARPLFGRRVLVTRPRDQAAELVDQLTALGAEAIQAPMIRIVPPEDIEPLRRTASEPELFDWIVFTSANAVDAFMAVLLSGERDIRALKGPLLCAVGTATADKLASYGIKVDLMPGEFRAERVGDALVAAGAIDGARVLLPRADIGRDVIAEQLRAAGALVTDVVAYRTILEDTQREGDPDIYGMLLEGRIDAVTFTSSSAVRNFVTVFGRDQAADLLKSTVVAAIGPVTADTAAQHGIQVTVQPTTYTVAGMVEAVAAHFNALPLGR